MHYYSQEKKTGAILFLGDGKRYTTVLKRRKQVLYCFSVLRRREKVHCCS